MPAVIGIFNKFPHIEHKAVKILGSNVKDRFLNNFVLYVTG